MVRILISDDEEDCRYYLSKELAVDNEVVVAASGKEAIELGTKFRPEILITDWMLKDHIHGLHVSKALRRIVPKMETVLITGFCSSDLKKRAERAGVYNILLKPFDFEDLARAIACMKTTAGSSKSADSKAPLIGLIEFSSSGRINYLSIKAGALLTAAFSGRHADNIAEVLSSDTISSLPSATKEWQTISPLCDDDLKWLARYHYDESSDTAILLLLEEEQQFLLGDPTIKHIVDTISPCRYRWPYSCRGLVIDDQEILRDVVVTQLEVAGCVCHAAESYSEALRLLERDEGIEVIILDYEMPDHLRSGRSVAEFIEVVRKMRAKIAIVGNSGANHESDFLCAGASFYLPKPWRLDELLKKLSLTRGFTTG